jgi:Domain of unknown function (DUF1848)
LAESGFNVDWEPQLGPAFSAFIHQLVEVSIKHKMDIRSCAEDIDLAPMGIKLGKCIDDELIKKSLGVHVGSNKDKAQREACGCVKSRDIGSYNSCGHGCLYCYATANHYKALKTLANRNADSETLIPRDCEKDTQSDRKRTPELPFLKK